MGLTPGSPDNKKLSELNNYVEMLRKATNRSSCIMTGLTIVLVVLTVVLVWMTYQMLG